ncbi:hypothetical protein PT974_01126 [Cladobotryum mycophilum]|uniref:RGS domain-containing protein n=1 Tax=Cladobotryum mycophilum TaxID=491253 RepID=A0ABR0T2U8_9HYPO
MVLSLSYTRPKRVDSETFRQSRESIGDEQSEGSVKSGTSGSSSGIPDSLSFDKIMTEGTCPPMTVRDFMNYLVYVEHAAENLQFYLWFKNYEKRFGEAQTTDISLAPEWTQAMEDDVVAKVRKDQAEKLRSEPEKTAALFKGTEFEKQPTEKSNPFNTPPRSSNGGDTESVTTAWTGMPSTAQASTHVSSYTAQAANAFQAAGAKVPFTIQPFREEINRVIATYIMDGAPRQLNLASWEQKAAVQALSYTTHPSAFRLIFKAVDSSLRRQAHPNFVRWSICNGNPARVFFARSLGVGLIIGGFVMAIVITLSNLGRGYRALAAIAWVLGISTLVAAYKGMCVVLHGMHHRHVRPWELFVHDDSEEAGKGSFESFGSSNSYEDEPWIVKYEKRNIIRKVFDREVWIQEPALRQIQDTIFIQAMLAALLIGGILTVVFVVMPGGKFF